VHIRDGLCFLLHMWICTPHATFRDSLLAWKGAVEYAWIVWSGPLVLALFRICPYIVLCRVMVLDVCDRMILRMLECRSANLVTFGSVFLLVLLVWGQALSHPSGGSASVNIISGGLCLSATLRANVSASSLCVTPVCDITLPCLFYIPCHILCG
jgi:hypothetical protein